MEPRCGLPYGTPVWAALWNPEVGPMEHWAHGCISQSTLPRPYRTQPPRRLPARKKRCRKLWHSTNPGHVPFRYLLDWDIRGKPHSSIGRLEGSAPMSHLLPLSPAVECTEGLAWARARLGPGRNCKKGSTKSEFEQKHNRGKSPRCADACVSSSGYERFNLAWNLIRRYQNMRKRLKNINNATSQIKYLNN